MTLSNYLKDLEEIVNIYSPDEKVILFGHSWGAVHAIMYVNEHPEKVAGVILCEPNSFTGEIENELLANIPPENLLSEAINDFYWSNQNISTDEHQMIDYSYINAFYNGLGRENYHYSETDYFPIFRFGAIASINGMGTDGMMLDGKYTYDFTTNLSQFTTKVLFINGDLGKILTVEYQEKNRAFLPNSEIKIIQNAGHDLVWIKAEEHVKLVREYLNEIL